MEEQLKRIKNKDLSVLDERLFGNLDKVETINSTLQNLGEFQSFLLKQISQFEEKAKARTKPKQVKQVIEQNCLTLRESIMRVMPDLQSSRAMFYQINESPQNTFRSTKYQNIASKEQCKQASKQKQLLQKQTQKRNTRKKHIQKLQQTTIQIQKIKKSFEQIKNQQKNCINACKKQIEKKIKDEIGAVYQENKNLKDQCKDLRYKNKELTEEIDKLKSLQASNEVQTQNKNQFGKRQGDKYWQKKVSEMNCERQVSSIKESSQSNAKGHQKYQSFVDKLNLDFTGKLKFFSGSQSKNVKINQSCLQYQDQPSTFRQLDTINLDKESSYNDNSRYAFRSIQLSRNIPDEDPNVPRLLKKNSVPNRFLSSNVSEKRIPNIVLPLNQTFNTGVKSAYQSVEKYITADSQKYSSNNRQSMTNKKSNHDLMRKTKSNFFRKQAQPSLNKENILSSETIFQTNICKMRGLNENSNGERKRNTQSKQKLKIFSMI